MSDYKTFHVGGGGNCVFFSTAKQLNADVHKNIRQEISQMYENELTREIIKDAAKNLIENQFKAGFANTALNWELHDYNFKGEDASDKIIQKLTTENSEINDMLALRLLTQVKSGNTKDYLGKKDGNNVDLYTKILSDYPKDVLQVISDVSPEGAKVPAILSVAHVMGENFATKLYKMEDGKISETDFVRKNDKWNSKEPSSTEISEFLQENNVDEKNILGLKGKNAHCKAYVNTAEKNSDEKSCLGTVDAESRSTSRGIKGFFVNIIEGIKSKIFGLFSPSATPSHETENTPQEKNKNEKEKIEPAKTKGLSKSASLGDFEAIDLEDDFGETKKIPPPPEEMNYEKSLQEEFGFSEKTNLSSQIQTNSKPLATTVKK